MTKRFLVIFLLLAIVFAGCINQPTETPVVEESEFAVLVKAITEKTSAILIESHEETREVILMYELTKEEAEAIQQGDTPYEDIAIDYIAKDELQFATESLNSFVICLENDDIIFMAYDVITDELMIDLMDIPTTTEEVVG